MKITRVISRTLGLKQDLVCPQCGRRMIRVKRRNMDRLLSVVVPVIRCSCCGRSFLVPVDRKEHQERVFHKN